MLSVMASACPSWEGVCVCVLRSRLLLVGPGPLQYSEAEFLCPCVTTIFTLHIPLGRHKPSKRGGLLVAIRAVRDQASLWLITEARRRSR